MDPVLNTACDKLTDLKNFGPSCASSKRENYISWQDYFMATALLSAKRSKDPVTQVGACIVDKENRIVAIGYNGFPRNCDDDKFPWCKLKDDPKGDPMNDKKMYVVHAEANAILNKNTASLEGTRLYTTLFPCNECTKLILQVGISEIFYISDKYAEKTIYRASKRMLEAAGVKYTRFQPTKKQILIDFNEVIQDELQSILGYCANQPDPDCSKECPMHRAQKILNIDDNVSTTVKGDDLKNDLPASESNAY